MTASESENDDLFWALCGGGGNFGVVTSFEYQLHPVGPIVNFLGAMYPVEKMAGILPVWRDFMAKAPPEFSCNCFCWTIPDVPAFPPEARNQDIVVIAGMHCGALDEGAAFIQPLRELAEPLLDLSGQLPYAVVQTLFDWAFPAGQQYYYWKSLYMNEINDEVMAIIKEEVGKRPAQSIMFDMWAMGGAVSRVSAAATAMGDRGAPFTFVFNTSWYDPTLSEACIEWTRHFYDRLLPYSTGGSYLNFPGFSEEEGLVEKAYGRNYARLAAIKARYDPDNLFRLNQNIKPAIS